MGKKNLLNGNPQIAIYSYDHIGMLINNYGIYEKEYLDLFFKFLKSKKNEMKNSIALDIGANIGNHSIYFSNYFKNVFAFEPNKKIYELLKVNSKNYSNIIINNFGISDIDEENIIFENANNLGTSFVSKDLNNIKNNHNNIVKLKKLDTIKDIFLEKVFLAKIDVEGFEDKVLKGGKVFFQHHRPIIILEQNLKNLDSKISNSLEFLKSYNYKFLVIERNFQGRFFGKLKFISLILQIFFGETLILKEIDKFQKKDYEMIVAIPN